MANSTDTTLPTRQLGTTGMDISRVGFGAWAIGGGDWRYGWGAQNDSDSIATIHHAVESGVNWIDTAAVYGLGHSETVVGMALSALPRPTGRMSSPRPAWCGTTPTTPPHPARS